MKKLEKPEYKIVQYSKWIGGTGWELGFSLMNKEETDGWEYKPRGYSPRAMKRHRDYPISQNKNNPRHVSFSYGF